MLTLLLAPFLLLWFLLLAMGWGMLPQRALAPTLGGLQGAMVRLLLGLLLLGTFVLIIGSLAWTPLVAYGALIALSLPALHPRVSGPFIASLRELSETWHDIKGKLTRVDRILMIALGLVMALLFLLAFTPDIGWDATTHHYAIPKLWLHSGHVRPIPEIIFGNYPGLAHLLYAWAFALQGEALAGLFNWAWALVLLLLIYSFGRTLHSRTAGLLAAFALFTCPTLYWMAVSGYIDLLEAAFIVAALIAWRHDIREGTTSPPWLAGILFGCAAATKHLAWLYLACLIAGRLFSVLRQREDRPTLRRLALEFGTLVGCTFLIAAPWYLRAYLSSGNPIDPFLPALFQPHALHSNPVSVRNWSAPSWHRGLYALVSYPFRFTWDMAFIGGWFRALSPIYLALLPLPLWVRGARYLTPVGFLGGSIVTYMALAFVLLPSNTRYALPLVVCASWLVGMVAAQMALQPTWRQRVLPVVLGLPLAVMLLLLVNQLREMAPTFLGGAPREAVLANNFPGIRAISWANANLPADARVITTDPRAYLMDFPYIIAAPGLESRIAPPWGLNDTPELLGQWRVLGITHVFLNETPHWLPEGYYLYELANRVEQDGLVLVTPSQAAAWSRGTLTPETAWAYAHETRAEILPDYGAPGIEAGVVRPDWLRRQLQSSRTPMMLGHIEAMRPILELIHDEDEMRLYRIRWDLLDTGAAELDNDRTLRYLMQGFDLPPEVIERGEAAYARIKDRTTHPYGE